MKTRIIFGTVVLCMVVIINSCENKQGAVPASVNLSNSCDTAKLTYSSGSNTMQAIINVQCGSSSKSCHAPGSSSGYDYSTYQGIDGNYKNGLLYSSLFGNLHNMPLSPQAGWVDSSACMLAKFKAWINQGCPQ